jgi:hypothetical protein
LEKKFTLPVNWQFSYSLQRVTQIAARAVTLSAPINQLFVCLVVVVVVGTCMQ